MDLLGIYFFMFKKQFLDFFFFFLLTQVKVFISSLENTVLSLKLSKLPTVRTSAQIVIIEINCKQLNAGSSNERYQGILIIVIISSQACNNT